MSAIIMFGKIQKAKKFVKINLKQGDNNGKERY